MEPVIHSKNSYERIQDFKNRIPEYDPSSGNHLWVVFTMFKVNVESYQNGDEGVLDHENLLSVVGPACFFCERAFSPLLATRKCKGSPPQ